MSLTLTPEGVTARCDGCQTERPIVPVTGWGWSKAGEADAASAGWKRVRDPGGGWFPWHLCGRCAGGLFAALPA